MRTARSTVVIVAGTLLLVGCASEAQPPPPEPPPDSGTTSEPADDTAGQDTGSDDEPAESPSPDDDVPERPVMDPPPRPEAMDDDGTAGAEAAAEYWFSLLTYTYATTETDRWLKMSSDECGYCTAVAEDVERLAANGGFVDGASAEVSNVSATAIESSNVFAVSLVVDEGPSIRHNRANGEATDQAGGSYRVEMAVEDTAEDWIVRAVEVHDRGE